LRDGARLSLDAVKRPGARELATAALACVLATSVVDAHAAHRTITRSQAPAVAAAVSLRHSDLPTFGQQRNPITKEQQKLNAQLTTCIGGVPGSLALAESQSPTFSTAGAPAPTISSTVEILPSATLVAKDLAAITGAKGVPCLKSQLRTQLGSSLVNGESLTVTAARLRAHSAAATGRSSCASRSRSPSNRAPRSSTCRSSMT
jgi:hypothetical protein